MVLSISRAGRRDLPMPTHADSASGSGRRSSDPRSAPPRPESATGASEHVVGERHADLGKLDRVNAGGRLGLYE
jgi:hypothetical protein